MAPSLILRGRPSKVALHFMNDKELSRVDILRDLTAGRLTVSAASDLMGWERRQVLRLSKAYQEHSATALISKKRGRASNRRTPTAIKDQGPGTDQGALRGFRSDASWREAARSPRHHGRSRDAAAVDARRRPLGRSREAPRARLPASLSARVRGRAGPGRSRIAACNAPCSSSSMTAPAG